MRVAILREEGSNGDREMSAAVYAAGMEPWDVHMSDLLAGTASLVAFQGIVFVGGFWCGCVWGGGGGLQGDCGWTEWGGVQCAVERPRG